MRNELNATRKITVVDLGGFRANSLQDFNRVLPAARKDGSLNDVVLIRKRGRGAAPRLVHPYATETELIADLHLADVADCDRCAVADTQNGRTNVVQVLNQAQAPDDEHLGTAFDVSAAGVLITG